MKSFLTQFDGTGRQPRPIQIEALTWLQDNWNKSKVFALNLPTGVGKSAIARAIQLATRGDIVPPTNQLMDQYVSTYPAVNFLKGMDKYTCRSTQLSCGDSRGLVKEGCKTKEGHPTTGFCENCPYASARETAAIEPSMFNPYSLLYFNLTAGGKDSVLVVDEAHNLIDVLQGMAGKSFNSRQYTLPKSLADLRVDTWLKEQADRLSAQAERSRSMEKTVALSRELQHVLTTAEGYADNPENYAVEMVVNLNRTKSLCIQPVRPPKNLAAKVLGDRTKLILMSATLPKIDVRDILGNDDFLYLSLPSPIPPANRRIQYLPSSVKMNAKTDPRLIALEITRLVLKHPNENILVHLTYGMSHKVAPHLKFKHISNTPEDKDKQIEKFKREGGVFVASGCNEGIDLPGDFCRFNIIPVLFRLNPTDPVVKKRLGLPGGRDWYNEQTLKSLIQQAGRSTRSESDYSLTYILDPALPRLIRDQNLDVPAYFKEAIQWFV